ncbi:hypothetical protein B0H12DRAFT_706403 [Mycena haematopus]|nr:hypothetical protein B0H12DRAFT_706403 [Mycena haematopus]
MLASTTATCRAHRTPPILYSVGASPFLFPFLSVHAPLPCIPLLRPAVHLYLSYTHTDLFPFGFGSVFPPFRIRTLSLSFHFKYLSSILAT